MIGRRIIDVSGLPSVAHGHRDPLWWGVMMLIAIESTMFALLGASYFYLRGNHNVWPPTGVVQPPFALSTATLVLLFLTMPPFLLAYRAAKKESLRPIQLGFVLGTILNAAALATRGFEFYLLQYQWSSHVYGSLVWTIMGLHTFHLLSGLLENTLFTAFLFIGPIERKHMLDVRVSVIYWGFVVFSWVPFYLIIFVDSALRNSFRG